MKIREPGLDKSGDEASRRSVAVVRAVAALCVGSVQRRDG